MLEFSLIMTLILSLTMIGFGYLFIKKPPRTINYWYGYRTGMSGRNQDTWDFAHAYAGRVWLKSGWLTLLVSVPAVYLLRRTSNFEDLVLGLFYIQMMVLLLVIPITERALRKTFDREGKRRN
jgi:uncharacterized membrane protein